MVIAKFMLIRFSKKRNAFILCVMISLFYLSLLALFYVKLSFETIGARRKYKISLGQGPNHEIAGLVAAHSNFQAYVPLLALLMYPLEQASFIPVWAIHLLWVLIFIGRVCHYLGIRNTEQPNFKLRVVGMQLTFFPLIILSSINLWRSGAMFLK